MPANRNMSGCSLPSNRPDSYKSSDIIQSNGKTISENGFHEAVEINGRIFDNNNPSGISKEDFYNGLERAVKLPDGRAGKGNSGTLNITETTIQF